MEYRNPLASGITAVPRRTVVHTFVITDVEEFNIKYICF